MTQRPNTLHKAIFIFSLVLLAFSFQTFAATQFHPQRKTTMNFFEVIQILTSSFPWKPEKVSEILGTKLTLDSDGNTDSYEAKQIPLGSGVISDEMELRFTAGSTKNPVVMYFLINSSSTRITYEEVKQKYPKMKFFGGPEPDSPLTTSFAVKESWGNLIFTFGENDCLTDVGFQNKAFFDEKN